MNPPSEPGAPPAFLAGGGEVGQRIRSHDWLSTSLGAPDDWPSALKTAVSLLLSSAGPAYIGWGPDLLSFYNDGYLPILGAKHPGIGVPFKALWPELGQDLAPLIDRTLAGEVLHFENMPLKVDRPVQPDGFFSFTYTPLRDDNGAIAGLYCAAKETTDLMLEERRQAIILEASERLTSTRSVQEVIDVLRRTARAAIGAEGIAIILKEEDRCFYVAEDASSPLWTGSNFDADTCVSGWAMKHGQTVAISDIRLDVRIPQAAYAPTFVRSLVMAPIGLPEAFAAIGAYWSDVMVHDRRTIDRLEGLARLAAVAIENARLTEARDRAAALSAAQNRILELAVVDAPLGETLEAIVQTVESQSNTGVLASILLLTPDGATLRHGAAPSLPDAYNEAIDGIAVGPKVGSCGSAVFRGAPVFVSDIATDPLWADFSDLAIGHGLRACWSIPIRSPQGNLLGTFAMYHREPRAPVPSDLEIVDFVVRTAGLVIERSRAEAARRESDEQLRELNETLEARVAYALAERQVFATVVESSPTLTLVCDLDLGIVAINTACVEAFERLYGSRPQPGDTLLALIPDPDQRRQAAALWARALAGEEFVEIALFGDPSRDQIPFEIRLNRLLDREGRQIGAVEVAHDISERVRAQADLEMAQEALRQSQKMEAMGQLTGGVAHDFNNLLTPIVGCLDLLQRRSVGGEREQRLIVGAMQSAERATTLVQRLLAFARRQPLQATAVDIAKLIHGMGELVASTTGPQIRVVVEASSDLPPAKADLNQLEMALLNLAVNARDAMPDGGTLRISATVEAISPSQGHALRPGAYIKLSVADTGVGMDESTLARAVEPFFSTKGIGRGTGLGLSMVHGLASQLGGELVIRSRVGLGTNIELWLPQSPDAPEDAVRASDPQLLALHCGTALLVDDEEAVRVSTADMLHDLGFKIVEAATAEEALRLVRGGARFDLLVTDHLMPGMSGSELAREVRPYLPDMPALLVSGYAEFEGIDPDLPRLIKPFKKDELAHSLAQLR